MKETNIKLAKLPDSDSSNNIEDDDDDDDADGDAIADGRKKECGTSGWPTHLGAEIASDENIAR